MPWFERVEQVGKEVKLCRVPYHTTYWTVLYSMVHGMFTIGRSQEHNIHYKRYHLGLYR